MSTTVIWKELPAVNSNMFYEPLWDPHQTHGLYGVRVDDVPYWKEYLKKHGAKKFRVVKNRYGRAIICFAWQVDKEAMEARRQKEILAKEKADKARAIIDTTLFGKSVSKKSMLYERITRYVEDSKISVNVLNARNIDELMTPEMRNSKDYQRIYDIIRKTRKERYYGASLIENIDINKARHYATLMSNKIKSTEKKLARKIAAQNLGFGFIAECFE